MVQERYRGLPPAGDHLTAGPGRRDDSSRARDLVFTLFGEYLLAEAQPIWVGSIIELLRPVGVAEGRTRTALSRMAKKGWLETRRVGRHAFYDLSAMGRSLLEEGRAKILQPTWDYDWDGSWILLAYSIPQAARKQRDRLRDRLAWLGFGSIGNGLWLSPHDVHDEVGQLAERMRLGDHLVWFRAHRVGGEDVRSLVERCWDLDALDDAYRDFANRWRPVLARWAAPRARGATTGDVAPEAAFADRFLLIHEFRRFRLTDPFLPRELLPEPWAGDAASALVLELYDRLVEPADRWVVEVLRNAPGPP